MAKKKTRSSRSTASQRAAGLVAVVMALVLGLAALAGLQTTTVQTAATPTLNPLTPTSIPFPTVPPGGTVLIADHLYIQSTGLLSVPHIQGWELPQTNPEEVVTPAAPPPGTQPATPSGLELSRVAATFINSNVFSVIHVFAEKDTTRKAKTLDDLNAYYDKTNLDAAWSNFTGGWKELNRGVQGDHYAINFELYLTGDTYLARQISRFHGDWLMVMRLVVPDNNPQLLDQLQTATYPMFNFWDQGLNAPLGWRAVGDSVLGYVVRFPTPWQLVDGAPGFPYAINGTLESGAITMNARAESGKSAKSEDEARSYISGNFGKANIQAVKPFTIGSSQGFSVNYTNPDADGNLHNVLTYLLNGANGKLIVVSLTASTAKTDFANPSANDAATIQQIRDSIFTLPGNQLIVTLTPSPSPIPPTPLPTTPAPSTTVPSSTSVPAAGSTAPATPAPPSATAAPASPTVIDTPIG